MVLHLSDHAFFSISATYSSPASMNIMGKNCNIHLKLYKMVNFENRSN